MENSSNNPAPYVDNPGGGFQETDEEFLERQFKQSVAALERVQALSPGEFESLIRTPARTDEERRVRSLHHEDIARRTLIAAQKYLISEEEFNIWSGRRKEAGQPVKFRFERAFANVLTPQVSCQRGALTGIIRSYVRLQDEIINDLLAQGEYAENAEELLQVEEDACHMGFLVLEPYVDTDVDGWPCYPRSTGRFRGSTRLRQFFEQRQSELPLPAELLPGLTEQIKKIQRKSEKLAKASKKSRANSTHSDVPPLTSFFAKVARFFKS